MVVSLGGERGVVLGMVDGWVGGYGDVFWGGYVSVGQGEDERGRWDI